MHAETIRDALHRRRPPPRPSLLDGVPARRVDGQHVVAVHLDAREAVGKRLLGDGARVGLLLERHGDGPLVVLADEDHGHVPDPGEVTGLVEIALGRRAVAEVDHDYRALAPVLDAIADADRVGQLGRHGDGDGEVTLLGAWLGALEPSGEEGQHLLDGPAAPEHGRRLAEGRHHPVDRLEREDTAYLRGLLPLEGREGADPALALELEHALVETPAQHHGAVEALEVVRRELGFELGVELAVAVQDGQALGGGLRLGPGPRGGGPRSPPMVPRTGRRGQSVIYVGRCAGWERVTTYAIPIFRASVRSPPRRQG